jgi:hypothetical protein
MNRQPPLTLQDVLQTEADQSAAAAGLFRSYLTAYDYLSREYYPWIQAACPFYTDHGENHVLAVTDAANLLLADMISNHQISLPEAYLLLFAILFHDSAMVLGRRGHPEKAARVIDELRALVPDPTLQRLLREIVKAHSGTDALRIPRSSERLNFSGGTYTIRARGLAAALRLADEISENRSRVAQAQLDVIPEENRIYWEYANAVNASAPLDKRSIAVDYELELARAVQEFKCSEYSPPERNGRLSLIEYLVYRVEKMNAERAYCCGASGGLLTYSRIRVTLTIIHSGARMKEFDGDTFWVGDRGIWQHDEEYPKIVFADGFFDRMPKYKAEALRTRLDAV